MSPKPRAIYVPAAHRKATKESRPKPPLELASLASSLAFRLVAWTGARPIVARVLALAAPPDPTSATRAFFADVPWTGARPPPPAGAALKSTVRTILSNFRWGD